MSSSPFREYTVQCTVETLRKAVSQNCLYVAVCMFTNKSWKRRVDQSPGKIWCRIKVVWVLDLHASFWLFFFYNQVRSCLFITHPSITSFWKQDWNTWHRFLKSVSNIKMPVVCLCLLSVGGNRSHQTDKWSVVKTTKLSYCSVQSLWPQEGQRQMKMSSWKMFD